MSCYSYKTIHETDDPILKNVDVSIILMMENSDRFIYDPFILKLSKKTIIQYNKGFKKCKKPDTIKMTNNDIAHAYYTAFEYSKNLGNIIVFEEDAEILHYNKEDYAVIDDYISQDFKVCSFSTYGIFEPIDDNFYSVDVAHGTHAQIISKKERTKIMQHMLDNDFKGECDTTYFVNNVVVYKKPLIVQLFPETENFNNWEGPKFLIKLGIKLTSLDTNKSGWEILYKIAKIRRYVTYKSLFLIILFVLVLFYYKK